MFLLKITHALIRRMSLNLLAYNSITQLFKLNKMNKFFTVYLQYTNTYHNDSKIIIAELHYNIWSSASKSKNFKQ